MLDPAGIIPFLQHSNHAVRELALRYLAEANDPSPATADDLWRAMDDLGEDSRSQFITVLSSLPQTESSVQRTLQELSAVADQSERDHLENAIAELRYGLLVRLDDVIGSATWLSSGLREHLKQRIELAGVPPAELWERLVGHAREIEQSGGDWNAVDPQIAQRLIEALARNPQAAQWAIATLSNPEIHDLREIWSVVLLGQMRFGQAFEVLLYKLTRDVEADFLIEACVNALAKIGGTDTIRLIGKTFRQAKISFRYHMADILRRIKLPLSETTVIALLGEETATDVRTFLANALTDLACTLPQGLNLLEQIIVSGGWHRQILPLETDVGALFTMLGKLPPQAPSHSRMPAPFADAAREPARPAPPKKVAPIRRQSAKVGRNDPCPCGSGKKYKKCCGK